MQKTTLRVAAVKVRVEGFANPCLKSERWGKRFRGDGEGCVISTVAVRV